MKVEAWWNKCKNSESWNEAIRGKDFQSFHDDTKLNLENILIMAQKDSADKPKYTVEVLCKECLKKGQMEVME